MPALLCLDEEALLPLALGETAPSEVQAHLEGCERCRAQLRQLRSDIALLGETVHYTTPALTRPSPGPKPAAPAPARAAVRPAFIGNYPVVGDLGSGGEATVFRGLHPSLGVEVALKWSRRPANPEEGDRLTAEGRLLARLKHPHIVRVYDLDVHEGRPFLVMEYVRGGNLEEVAGRKRYAPEQAARLVLTISQALAAAHREKVTHQDITPRNILIDEEGQPRLTDFGMARLLHGAGTIGQPVGGTPGYMAPEQARGEVERIGPASDLFGLGGVLYFLLAGRAPISGDNPYRVQQQTAQGAVDLAALGTCGAPRPLTSICRKALATDPAARYPSADALAGDLQSYLGAKHRRRFLAVLGAGAVVMATGGWMLYPRTKPDDPLKNLSFRAYRGEKRYFNLQDALPFKPGDSLVVECELPAGVSAGLFAFNGVDGTVQCLAVSATTEGELPRLKHVAAVSGPAGTDLLLVCAGNAASINGDKVAGLVAGEGPWPALPEQSLLLLTPEGVDDQGEKPRDFAAAALPVVEKVKDRLDRLRHKLREAGVASFRGVAYPHE